MHLILLLTAIACALLTRSYAEGNDKSIKRPVVQINSGKVQGYISKSRDGNVYYGFQTIPFAAPPVGSLRFKPPQLVDHWEGVRDGAQLGPLCPQTFQQTLTFIGEEDCLYLNVYTPKLEHEVTTLLPVLFWIHGGGFLQGTGRNDVFGPQYFMDHQVVLVTTNYRLNVLGFLNTEDENVYGNYGMLDQVWALKWVQENIVTFGGDPRKVTLFGVSAGSAAVLYHMLSPLSSGLFYKAIAQSGSVTNYWALNREPLQYAKTLAGLLNCPNVNDTKAIVQCLSTKSVEDIVNKEFEMRESYFFPIGATPSLESKGGPGFLTEEALTLLKEGRIANRVPLIIGLTAEEGYTMYYDLKMAIKTKGNAYYEKQFPFHISLHSTIKPDNHEAHKLLAELYYENEDVEDEEVFERVAAKIFGDAMFGPEISRATELFSQAGIPTYAYIISHPAQQCMPKLYGYPCGKYSTHADDYYLLFLFQNATLETPEDIEVSKRLTNLWVSFASDSDLNINNHEQWPRYDVTSRLYVDLKLSPEIKQGLLSDNVEFWTETIPRLTENKKIKDEL
ncbi:hypothetical protein CHUAL_009795 [Chamberlinius hualienensis]